MTINLIIEGIKNSPLDEEVKKKAIRKVEEDSEYLGQMFNGIGTEPQALHDEFYAALTDTAVGTINPVLTEHKVPVPKSIQTYQAIYARISGKK